MWDWSLKSFLQFVFAFLAVLVMLEAPASAKGFYAGGYGGANWNDVGYDNGWLTLDNRTGYVIGGVIGTSIDSIPGLRVEGDLSYRRNGVDVTICDDVLKAYDSTWGILANAVYDIPVGTFPVHPYLLAGIGYASRTGALQQYGLDLHNAGLAYQLGGGVQTQVAENVVLGVGYRYFQSPDLSYGDIHADGANHSLIATATFAFP